MEHFLHRSKCSIFHSILKKSYISKVSKGACVELRVNMGLYFRMACFQYCYTFQHQFSLFSGTNYILNYPSTVSRVPGYPTSTTTSARRPKRWMCGECGKYYDSNYALEMHSRIHSGQKPFKCELCGCAFTQKGTLRSHMMTHMDKDEISKHLEKA